MVAAAAGTFIFQLPATSLRRAMGASLGEPPPLLAEVRRRG